MSRRGVPSSVRGVFEGEVDLGGVVILRLLGLELLAEGLDGERLSRRYILLVSGSVRTDIGEVWVGSSSGEEREARGVVGGVPRSDTGAS